MMQEEMSTIHDEVFESPSDSTMKDVDSKQLDESELTGSALEKDELERSHLMLWDSQHINDVIFPHTMIVLRYQNIFYSRPLLSAEILQTLYFDFLFKILYIYIYIYMYMWLYLIKDKFHINNSIYIFFNYTFFQNVYFYFIYRKNI